MQQQYFVNVIKFLKKNAQRLCVAWPSRYKSILYLARYALHPLLSDPMKSFFANLIPFCLVAAIGTLVFQELFNRDEPVNGGQKQASAITAMPSQLSFDEQH